MTKLENASAIASLLSEAEGVTETDNYWIKEGVRKLQQQQDTIYRLETAIEQLRTDLEFQGNKIKELTLDCKSYHEFFAKHDPMGYRAYYTQHLPSWISK